MHILNEIPEIEEFTVKKLSDTLHISSLLAKLFASKGISDDGEIKRFLNPRLTDLHNPFLMKDMEKGVDRIIRALDSGEKIIIYGDEDVDGISATALLMDILKDLGGQVSYVIPNKARDGLGLREKFIDQAKSDGVELIVTVDCGITNFSQVEYAKERDIDVIITDHHITLNQLPQALAVINPKRKDDDYPFSMLSGAGVAYKVGQAIAMKKMGLSSEQWHSVKRQLLIHVMLGTIGDRVPLVNENRIFVKFGLEALGVSKKHWVSAICQNSRFEIKPRTISAILTHFIPLLSSGESVNGKNISCDLLLSRDPRNARDWASELYLTSQDWLYRARQTYKKIRTNISCSDNESIVIIVEKDSNVDVLSYCSSKLKDGLNKPVIVIGFKEDSIVGEARAPKGFDLMECFKQCSSHFIDYGGHKCAAGFSSTEEHLAEIIPDLVEVANSMQKNKAALQRPQLRIQIELNELTPQLIAEFAQLSPYGEGNPAPIFVCNDIQLQRIRSGFHVPESKIIFWGTRKTRHHWVFPYGQPVNVNINFVIDGNSKLFITNFRKVEDEQPTE